MRRPRIKQLIVALTWMLAGCANADNGGDAGLVPSPDIALADPKALGAKLVHQRGCADCHDPGDHSLSGQTTARPQTMAYGRNLTPDPDTGLGSWTDEQVVRAMRTGVDNQDQELCLTMPRFSDLTDPEANALVSYLRSLPLVHHDIPGSICPPLKNPQLSTPDAGAPRDAMAPPDDLLMPPPTDMAAPKDGAVPNCAVKINEVQTAGTTASDEFVEILNPCGATVTLTNWKLVYRAANAMSDFTLGIFPKITLAPKGHMLLGGNGYTGNNADLIYSGGSIATPGGGVGLRDPVDTLIDSVGYGTATNAFVRGMPAPAPAAKQSIERLPDGKDTGNNSVDFKITSTPTPGQINQ